MADQDPPPPPGSLVPSSPAISPEKPISKPSILATSPISLLYTQLSNADRTILRLNKLLSTPAGQSKFLGTFQYTLYLLGYVTKTLPSPAALLRLILLRLRLSSTTVSPATASSSSSIPLHTSISTFGSVISNTRTTLRLFALPALYSWLKALLAETPNPSTDSVIHYTALAQCISYILYQALENVAHLHDKGIIKLKSKQGSGKLWLWSCRFWMLGVGCDFVKLGREAILESAKRRQRAAKDIKPSKEEAEGSTVLVPLSQESSNITTKEMSIPDLQQSAIDAEIDRQWYSRLRTASSWFPMCVHYSVESGLPGMNQGVVGALGLIAEMDAIKGLWEKTA